MSIPSAIILFVVGGGIIVALLIVALAYGMRSDK